MPEHELPSAVRRAGAAGLRWWRALTPEARRELQSAWNPRANRVAYSRAEHGFERLPIRLQGVFVDPELARENAMWTRHLTEYIQAHPEVTFHLQERTFHICRAHPTARRVVATGVIAADFRCPFARHGCPLLGGQPRSRHAVHLVPV